MFPFNQFCVIFALDYEGKIESLKGTVSDLSFKNSHAQFTTVPLLSMFINFKLFSMGIPNIW